MTTAPHTMSAGGMSSQSDADVMRAVADHDPRALEELYTRYARRLLGLIRVVVRDQQASEDVLQNVFAEVWTRQAARYQEALGPVDSWLLRLAKSRAIDELRKRSRREHPVEAPGATSAPNDEDAPENRRQVLAELSKLPEDESAPIRLAFYEGRTHASIAEQLNLPMGTVKTRLRRGLKKLGEAMSSSRNRA